jgi:uncharacterized protein
MADHFVKDPRQEVRVQQKVMVTVLDVDLERKRISLSMKGQTDHKGKGAKGTSRGKRKGSAPQESRRVPSPNNPFVGAFGKQNS